jgi:hypothetical protein
MSRLDILARGPVPLRLIAGVRSLQPTAIAPDTPQPSHAGSLRNVKVVTGSITGEPSPALYPDVGAPSHCPWRASALTTPDDRFGDSSAPAMGRGCVKTQNLGLLAANSWQSSRCNELLHLGFGCTPQGPARVVLHPRAVDAFVGELEFKALGFESAELPPPRC